MELNVDLKKLDLSVPLDQPGHFENAVLKEASFRVMDRSPKPDADTLTLRFVSKNPSSATYFDHDLIFWPDSEFGSPEATMKRNLESLALAVKESFALTDEEAIRVITEGCTTVEDVCNKLEDYIGKHEAQPVALAIQTHINKNRPDIVRFVPVKFGRWIVAQENVHLLPKLTPAQMSTEPPRTGVSALMDQEDGDDVSATPAYTTVGEESSGNNYDWMQDSDEVVVEETATTEVSTDSSPKNQAPEEEKQASPNTVESETTTPSIENKGTAE